MFAAWWRRLWSTSDSLGDRGERLAAKHLEGLGYRILERSRSFRFAEIDLIAADGRTVVFVEVKTRRTTDRGRPAEAVDRKKQAKISRAALAYLKMHRILDRPTRFDVVSVLWADDEAPPKVAHFRHAFEAQGPRGMYS